MVAYLKNLSLANVSNILRRVSSIVLEGSEDDKDGEFGAKIEFVTSRQSGAMETAHRADLFTDKDSPCTLLARPGRLSPALSLPCSWYLSMKITQNHEDKILTGERNEHGGCT